MLFSPFKSVFFVQNVTANFGCCHIFGHRLSFFFFYIKHHNCFFLFTIRPIVVVNSVSRSNNSSHSYFYQLHTAAVVVQDAELWAARRLLGLRPSWWEAKTYRNNLWPTVWHNSSNSGIVTSILRCWHDFGSDATLTHIPASPEALRVTSPAAA